METSSFTSDSVKWSIIKAKDFIIDSVGSMVTQEFISSLATKAREVTVTIAIVAVIRVILSLIKGLSFEEVNSKSQMAIITIKVKLVVR